MPYPIVLLSSWVLESVLSHIRESSAYVGNMVSKNFVKYESPGKCNLDWTPILRVFKFTQSTEAGELTAVLNDSTHKILSHFNRECVRRFETKHKQRLTYHTTNSLVLVRRANLRFVSLKQLRAQFGVVAGLQINARTEIVVLEVLEVDMFQRDQIRVPASAENTLRFIYAEGDYKKRCRKYGSSGELQKKVIEDNGGMISDEEDLVKPEVRQKEYA